MAAVRVAWAEEGTNLVVVHEEPLGVTVAEVREVEHGAILRRCHDAGARDLGSLRRRDLETHMHPGIKNRLSQSHVIEGPGDRGLP